MSNIPLSASRIKTLQTCSWMYWAKYILKIPDKSNVGSLRGSIAHAVFEALGNPKHKHHYNKIIKFQDVSASPAVERMVNSFCKKNKIDDFENLDLVNKMILEGLNYDFFGEKIGKPTESFSEKSFDLDVDEDGKNYRIIGFIDKLFLFKKKRIALIRDFKTSKSIFSGDEVEDNMQNLMYCLAVKHLYPDFIKRKMEFLFLKFDCNGEGKLEMEEISDDELEGFEFFLTGVQKILNEFSESDAMSKTAYDEGFSKGGFSGRTVCGMGTVKGQLKKDGTPMWACPAKWPFDYWVLKNKEGVIISSAFEKKDLKEKAKQDKNLKIEKVHYEGCPKWNRKNLVDNYDPFL